MVIGGGQAGLAAASLRRAGLDFVVLDALVRSVHRTQDGLRVETDTGVWNAGAVISATGTWWRPFVPTIPGTFTRSATPHRRIPRA